MESFKKVSSAILSHIFFLHRGFDILFDHQGIDIHSVKILAMRHHKKQFFNALCGLVKAICYVGLICKMSWIHVKICETAFFQLFQYFIHSFDVVLYMHFVPIRRFANKARFLTSRSCQENFWREVTLSGSLFSEEENCPII